MIKENISSKNSSNDDIIKCKMISANCNTLLNGAAYSNTYSCLAYTSSNLIHLYDPKSCKTFVTLKGHKQRVNVVRWIDSNKNKNDLIELLSCSSDGTIIHWVNGGHEKNPFDHNSWKIEQVYNCSEPSQSVNLLFSLYISPIEKYFVCFSASGKADLFYFDVDLNEYKMFHSLSFKKKLQDAITLTVLDDNYLLLLTGGYDHLINIYTVMRIREINHHLQYENAILNFNPCSFKISLTGHLNGIRDIVAICSTLDFTDGLSIATCSQDSYIRIWQVVKLDPNELKLMADTINQKGSLSVFDEYKSKTSYVIKTDKEEYYNIMLDSVLNGHEESVSSIRWGYLDNQQVILSSSFDFTVGIWKYDKTHNIWNKDVTLGEMVGNKHAFFSAIFIERGAAILAYTYNGAFYLWRFSENEKMYRTQPIVHGHFGPVSDLDWDPTVSKGFLLTTSEDQTTRIVGEWKKNNSWHEINRPQIHGYDINTIACLNEDVNGNYISKLVSGADEKIVRIFNATFNLVKYLSQLSEVNINFSKEHDNSYYEKCYASGEGSKQALGLMTKQVKMDVPDDEEAPDLSNFNPDEMLTNKVNTGITTRHDYSIPPDEDFLTNNTLWPEANKLYGHGYEIICLAVSHNGKYIASGGKAQSEKHSKLFIWSSEKSQLICKLDGHILTIVQIEFSKDDEFILTVSRDRSLCLYKKNNDEKMPYVLVQTEKETHLRIIWGCSWSYDSELFATGSRDTFVKIWRKINKTENGLDSGSEKFYEEIISSEFSNSVTSLNIVPQMINNNYILLVGFANGEIKINSFNVENKNITSIASVHNFLTHGATVRRIKSFVTKENVIRFASCSDDYSVRIFEIEIDSLKKLIQ